VDSGQCNISGAALPSALRARTPVCVFVFALATKGKSYNKKRGGAKKAA